MADLTVVNLTADLAPQCADLELLSFPHADPADLLSEEDIRAYARVFPEGFFVVLDDDRVVGQGAGIFLDFDLTKVQHSLLEATGEHQCGNHDPAGAWYYGTDIVVHPDYRGRGIGRRLYELRKDLVRRHGKRGIVAGGHIPGYADHRHEMSAEEYIGKVAAGELFDPTLTMQLHNGFRALGAISDYIHDEATGSWSAFIVWENPDFAAVPPS